MVDTKWKKTKNIDDEEDIYESFSSIKKTNKPINETKVMEDKINNIHENKKGFTKLPMLESIYEGFVNEDDEEDKVPLTDPKNTLEKFGKIATNKQTRVGEIALQSNIIICFCLKIKSITPNGGNVLVITKKEDGLVDSNYEDVIDNWNINISVCPSSDNLKVTVHSDYETENGYVSIPVNCNVQCELNKLCKFVIVKNEINFEMYRNDELVVRTTVNPSRQITTGKGHVFTSLNRDGRVLFLNGELSNVLVYTSNNYISIPPADEGVRKLLKNWDSLAGVDVEGEKSVFIKTDDTAKAVTGSIFNYSFDLSKGDFIDKAYFVELKNLGLIESSGFEGEDEDDETDPSRYPDRYCKDPKTSFIPGAFVKIKNKFRERNYGNEPQYVWIVVMIKGERVRIKRTGKTSSKRWVNKREIEISNPFGVNNPFDIIFLLPKLVGGAVATFEYVIKKTIVIFCNVIAGTPPSDSDKKLVIREFYNILYLFLIVFITYNLFWVWCYFDKEGNDIEVTQFKEEMLDDTGGTSEIEKTFKKILKWLTEYVFFVFVSVHDFFLGKEYVKLWGVGVPMSFPGFLNFFTHPFPSKLVSSMKWYILFFILYFYSNNIFKVGKELSQGEDFFNVIFGTLTIGIVMKTAKEWGYLR